MATSPYLRALLDTIAGSESPGYDVVYGGKRVSDLSKHPGIYTTIKSGPNAGKKSSAAGRYQMLESTWNRQAKKLGLSDFSPESQDAAAADLASTAYKEITGRSLESDLASGDPEKISGVGQILSGVWTSLPGGIETNKTGTSFPQRLSAALSKLSPIGSANADEMESLSGDPVIDEMIKSGKARLVEDQDIQAQTEQKQPEEQSLTGDPVIDDMIRSGKARLADDTTDEQIADDFAAVNAIAPEEKETDGLHTARVAGGGLLKGAAGIVTAPYDAAVQIYNEGLAPIAEKYGLPPQVRIPYAGPALSALGEKTGIAPAPQNSEERVIERMAQGAGGAASASKLLTGLLSAGATTGSALYNSIMGAVSGGAGALAGEAGASPLEQAIVSGITPIGVNAIRAGGRGVLSSVVGPSTKSSRELAAGTLLRRSVQNPDQVANTIEANAEPVLKGSPVTTAQAGRDAGLWALEKGARARNPSFYGAIDEAKNTARASTAELVRTGGASSPEEALEIAQAYRSAAALPLLQEAKAAGATINVNPILSKIDEIMGSESGVRPVVKSALNDVKRAIGDVSASTSSAITGVRSAQAPLDLVYGVRKTIGDMMSGKLKGDAGNVMLAKKELLQVREILDDAIDEGLTAVNAGGKFDQYLNTFREASKAVNRIELGEKMWSRGTAATPTPNGDPRFTPASVARVERNRKDFLEFEKLLTPAQKARLEAIKEDVMRSAPIEAGRGSDTYQKMLQDLAIAKVFGGDYQGLLGLPIRGLAALTNKVIPRGVNPADLSERAVNELIDQAMANPRLAADLMRRAGVYSPNAPFEVPTIGGLLSRDDR